MQVRIKTAEGFQTVGNVVEVSVLTEKWPEALSLGFSEAYKAAEPAIHVYSAHSIAIESMATNTIIVRRSKAVNDGIRAIKSHKLEPSACDELRVQQWMALSDLAEALAQRCADVAFTALKTPQPCGTSGELEVSLHGQLAQFQHELARVLNDRGQEA